MRLSRGIEVSDRESGLVEAFRFHGVVVREASISARRIGSLSIFYQSIRCYLINLPGFCGVSCESHEIAFFSKARLAATCLASSSTVSASGPIS